MALLIEHEIEPAPAAPVVPVKGRRTRATRRTSARIVPPVSAPIGDSDAAGGEGPLERRAPNKSRPSPHINPQPGPVAEAAHNEIEPAPAAPVAPVKVRRTRARKNASAMSMAPVSAPIGDSDAAGGEGPRRKRAPAKFRSSPRTNPQPGPTAEATDDPAPAIVPDGIGEEGANANSSTKRGTPPLPLLSIAQQANRRRRFAMVQRMRLERSTESLIVNFLHDVMPEDTQKAALFVRAARIRRAVEAGKILTDNAEAAIADQLVGAILNAHEARKGFLALEQREAKVMAHVAVQLPVWAWAKDIVGLGPLSVALIAAEAHGPRGDVGSYATKERIWKRFGLAVISGQRQRRVTNAEQAAEHGYSPQRRSVAWVVASMMFMHQWGAAKDGQPAGPKGPYGHVYMRRLAHLQGRDMTPLHRMNDAKRVMFKAVLEDYWRVWRGLSPLDRTGGERCP